MKYIRKYEDIEDEEPQIGDYVLCKDKFEKDEEKVLKFIENNMGKFIRYTDESDCDLKTRLKYPYIIKYNIPNGLFSSDEFDDNFTVNNKPNIRLMGRDEIIYFSPNLEVIQTILASKKYNL